MQSGQESLQQHPKSPDGATAGTDPVAAGNEAATPTLQPIAGTSPANNKDAAGAEAATTQSQSVTANSNHPAKPRRAPSNRKSRAASVAEQQKSKMDALVLVPAGMFPSVDYTAHSDDELHNATVAALAVYTQKREEADAYAYDVLIPALNQIIHRYKQQGRAASYRLNGCPTVEKYFESIGLNYSTVRSWKSRAQQRLLQAATDAGTKPAPGRTSDRDPVPHFNRAERKALIEGNHRAVEIVPALEAGRDGKKEIADFKSVMNAERLDDILQAHDQEPDYKGILSKVLQTVADTEASLPASFVKAVRELTKPCKFKITAAPVASQKNNSKTAVHGGSSLTRTTPLQIAPIPQKPPEWLPLDPGKKYTARPHPQGGWGVYEPGSNVCWQKHPRQDGAWDAIEAVKAVSPSLPQASNAGSEAAHA